LRRVDEDGVGPVGPQAELHIAEKLEVAGGDHAQGIVTLAVDLLPARDPVEDQLRDAGVAAHHDEHGRGEAAALAGLVGGARPGLVVLLVVAVEADERRLELLGQLGHATGDVAGLAALLRQAVLDVRPQVPVHRD
jgi:hypothetical protein